MQIYPKGRVKYHYHGKNWVIDQQFTFIPQRVIAVIPFETTYGHHWGRPAMNQQFFV